MRREKKKKKKKKKKKEEEEGRGDSEDIGTGYINIKIILMLTGGVE